MNFRTIVVTAVVLVLAAAGALAVLQIGEDARAETDQQTITREDSLAVEPDIRQKLVSDADHDPTRYGDNGTETVELNGTILEPGPNNYTYYPADGELEFNRDDNASANVTYQYDIPSAQAADDQLQTGTESTGLIAQAVVAAAFVVLLLAVGGFFLRKLARGGRQTRGR